MKLTAIGALGLMASGLFAQGLNAPTCQTKDSWEEINFEFNSSILSDGNDCAVKPPTGPCRCVADMGYSRALPFEHIYRHHRRYRITEGTEEIQMRRVAQYLFAFGKHATAA